MNGCPAQALPSEWRLMAQAMAANLPRISRHRRIVCNDFSTETLRRVEFFFTLVRLGMTDARTLTASECMRNETMYRMACNALHAVRCTANETWPETTPRLNERLMLYMRLAHRLKQPERLTVFEAWVTDELARFFEALAALPDEPYVIGHLTPAIY